MTKQDSMKKILEMYTKISIKCNCGHTLAIPLYVDKKICSWCGCFVYRNKKLEFKEKLLKKIREEK